MAKKKVPRGRPAHQPTDATRKAVEIMAASGLWQYQIAAQMKLTDETLTKYYAHELETGWATTIAAATNVIVTEMLSNTDKSLDAAKFFLKSRGKGLWSETKQVELSGPNGGPILTQSIDIDALDSDQQEQLESMLNTVLALPTPNEEIVYEPWEYDEEEAEENA
jgi:hypothetical protein